MQFALTPEQEMIAETARTFLSSHAGAHRAGMSFERGYDPALWTTLVRDMGFGATALSVADGGAGLGLVEVALVMIELGRSLLPSPYLTSIATALPIIQTASSREQADRLVTAIASGDLIAAPILDRGLRVDGGRVSGTALVSFGGAADLFVIVIEQGAALVEAAAATVSRPTSMDPTRPLARVHFADVPVEPLPNGEGVAAAIDRARVALAAECVGAADAALEATVAFTKDRVQFGRPIGSFQALKHRMADMMIEVEAARTAVYYAAAASDEHDVQAGEAAAIAHSTAIDAFRMVAGNMIQLHGGIGFTWEHDAHLFFKRAQSAGTLLGTPLESRRRLAALIGLDESEV